SASRSPLRGLRRNRAGQHTPRLVRPPARAALKHRSPRQPSRGDSLMFANYACNSPEHALSRRGFLAGVGAAGLAGFAGFTTPATAKTLEKAGKRVLVIWLSGGVSQLETW